MSREEFFDSFYRMCQLFPNKLAICMVDREKAQGIRYLKLLTHIKCLSTSLKKHLPERIYVGIKCNVKPLILFAILSIWHSKNAVAIVSHLSSFERYRSILKFKYILTDCQDLSLKDAECIEEISVDDANLYLYELSGEIQQFFPNWDMCYSLTTSGSTGVPKIIQVPWVCILPNVHELQQRFQLDVSDSILSVSRHTFDPYFIDAFLGLTTGATIVYVDVDVQLKRLFEAFQTEYENVTEESPTMWEPTECPHITFLQTTPSVLRHILREDIVLGDNSTLQILVLGGENFPNLKNNSPLRNIRIFNIYGITEISCWAFLNQVDEMTEDVSLGSPLNGIVYKIEDDVLHIGSSARKCLVDDEQPEKLPNLVFRNTGDLVLKQKENGSLYFRCRADRVCKKFGTKLNIGRLENILLEQNSIKAAYVVSKDDTIAWFLTLKTIKTTQKPVEANPHIYKELLSTLPDIEKPDLIIEMGEIPLTHHGKVDMAYFKSLIDKFIIAEKIDKHQKDIFKNCWCHFLSLLEPCHQQGFVSSGGSSILAACILSRLENPPSELLAFMLTDRSYEECLALFNGDQSLKRKFEPDRGMQSALSIEWLYNMGKCVDASPTLLVIQNVMYVVVGSHSSKLSLINCSNGQPLWSVHLGDRIESCVCATPDGSKLIVGCYDFCIYCLHTSTGHTLWKFSTGGIVKTTPKLSNDGRYVYFGSYDNIFYCLLVKDGSLAKSVQLSEGSILCSPILTPTNVFVATLDGTCASLDNSTLEVIWRRKVDSPVFSSCCLLAGGEDILFAEVNGSIHCFCTIDGKKKWTFKCDGNIFSGLKPVMHDERELVAFGCHDNHLYLLHPCVPATLLWKILLDSPIYSTPCLFDGYLVSVSTAGYLYLVTINGCLEGQLKLPGEVFSSPAVSEKRLFIGCRDNNLICIRINKGEPSLKKIKGVLDN